MQKLIFTIIVAAIFYLGGAITVQYNLFPYPEIVMLRNGKSFFSPKDFKKINITNDMVYGLDGYKTDKRFIRLPLNQKNVLRKVVWDLSKNPSGGRIKFKTNSNAIYIEAISKGIKTPANMTGIMKNGIDIYVNDIYYGSTYPNKDYSIKKLFEFQKDNDFNEITLYLPLYEDIEIKNILIPNKSKIIKSSDLLKIKPIIYYGTSITQGGCASNPGLSYQAILERRLKIDFKNLGFSGNGLGDIEIAKYISESETSLIVLDYWANPSPKIFKQTLPLFVKEIRKKHKNTPIIVVSPYYSVNRIKFQNEKRKIALDFVKQIKQHGDKNIYYLDGRKMLSKETSFGLVDGRHLNSLGFWFVANKMEKVIKKLLYSSKPNKYEETNNLP